MDLQTPIRIGVIYNPSETHLFSAIYRGPITPFITGFARAHLHRITDVRSSDDHLSLNGIFLRMRDDPSPKMAKKKGSQTWTITK